MFSFNDSLTAYFICFVWQCTRSEPLFSYDACVLDACLHLLGGRNFYRLVLNYVILIVFRDIGIQKIKADQEPSAPACGDKAAVFLTDQARVCFREGGSETVSVKEAVRR